GSVFPHYSLAFKQHVPLGRIHPLSREQYSTLLSYLQRYLKIRWMCSATFALTVGSA
ncbi:MAG: hypothetical protein UZ18_ATM001002380, partial [Armatimonadetes bacterium OLB18]